MIPLTPVIAAWSVLVPLVDEVPDPEDVKPGWLGFGVFLLLAAAVVLLVLSLRKQLRKVNFDERGDTASSSEGAGPGEIAGEATETSSGTSGEASGGAARDGGEVEARDQGDGEDGSRSS